MMQQPRGRVPLRGDRSLAVRPALSFAQPTQQRLNMIKRGTLDRTRAFGRSRWAAIGAAVAVTIGGGGVFATSAAGPSAPASTVTIDPCRLVDTREGGSRVGASETVTFSAHGSCGVPTSATALIANITVVQPTESGFVTVHAADAVRPVTSTLNWGMGTHAMSNQATIALSTAGTFSVYNMAGSAHLVIDVTGYMLPDAAGTGATGEAGAPGADGVNGIDGTNGTNGINGINGINGTDGSGEAPRYSHTRLQAGGTPQAMIDLGVPSLEFVAYCNWGLGGGGGGNIGAGVYVWTGPGDPTMVILADGTTATLGLNSTEYLATGSFGSRAGMKTSTVVTRGADAWEVDVSIDIDPAASTCEVHSVVTELATASI
jgi:hypothetical protein